MPRNVFPKTFACCLFLFITQYSFSQKTITGKVTDEKENAIMGASVMARGGEGVITDTSGAFTIHVPPGVKILVISYVRFRLKFDV